MNLTTSGLWRPGRPQSKNQRKKKERQVLKPHQRTENRKEYERFDDTNWCTWSNPQGLAKRAERIRTVSQDFPNNSTDKIDQNTEKSLGDLKRFAVTLFD